MIRVRLISRYLFPVFLTPALAWGGPPELLVPQIIQKLEKAHQSIQDLQVHFSQETHFSGFETTILSKGSLYYKKPNLLRWEYTEPNRNQVIINGEKIWIYTPELEQVIIHPFSDVSYSQIPLRLLAEVGHLERDFTIEKPNLKSRKDTEQVEDNLRIDLIPKRTDGSIRKIELEIDNKNYLIARINIFETTGGTSEIVFDRRKINSGIKDRFFTFTVPPGIEVIDMSPQK